ncbi:MAG: oxygen-independent coproporphyrinogen III oxidase [Pseudomonadota bacterium]
MDQSLVFDPALIARYDRSGPRYTSYPTAVQFHEGFGETDYLAVTHESNASGRPLSLYFHIPFCDTVCYYCACNKVVTKDRGLAPPYLGRIIRELALQGALFDRERVTTQLHWGGGTPTFLSHSQMTELMTATRCHFTLQDDDSGEYSIEIDPREANASTVALLRRLGFNRMSLGVQDFDPRVQKAVNRIQSVEETLAVLTAARTEGFRSISIDLIYGLPFQTVASFSDTLKQILAIAPDRLSVFNYAHLPERFKPQRRIQTADLPSPQERLDILHMTGDTLTAAGYVFIGMDHFARPDDELAVAQRQGTLYRNFQGYSTHADCDLVGLGVTAIGKVGATYAQNQRDLESYYRCIDAGHLAVFRGVVLNRDDEIRRDIITRLISHFALSFAAIEAHWGLVFRDAFQSELKILAAMRQDGLLDLDGQGIQVRPAGRLLIRNICMVFDRYLPEPGQPVRFSKVI